MNRRITGWQRTFLKAVQWADSFSRWLWQLIRPLVWWLVAIARRVFRVLWQEARGMAGWYVAHANDFRLYAVEYAPDLLSQGERRREIRVIPGLRDVAAEHLEGRGWHVVLPDCCVHCGHEGTGPWLDERREVENYGIPFWTVVLVITLSHLLALILWRFSLIPLGIVLGLAAGYRLRRTVPSRIRFRRCDEHADSFRYPALRVFGDELIIRVGAKSVRQRFLHGDRSDGDRSGFAVPTASWEDFQAAGEPDFPPAGPGPAGPAPASDSPTMPLVDLPDSHAPARIEFQDALPLRDSTGDVSAEEPPATPPADQTTDSRPADGLPVESRPPDSEPAAGSSFADAPLSTGEEELPDHLDRLDGPERYSELPAEADEPDSPPDRRPE
ncbi:MAG: hypothetical protein KDA79_21525 [Planctomycetaceae bacterium]|nr:hypothetical protein [Planctomycetaceae bacterium]